MVLALGLGLRSVSEVQDLPTEQYHVVVDPLVLVAAGLVLGGVWQTRRALRGYGSAGWSLPRPSPACWPGTSVAGRRRRLRTMDGPPLMRQPSAWSVTRRATRSPSWPCRPSRAPTPTSTRSRMTEPLSRTRPRPAPSSFYAIRSGSRAAAGTRLPRPSGWATRRRDRG